MSPVLLWHAWLGMPKHDRSWHERDVTDELAEYQEARGWAARWSELSDVCYTVTRARWSGHPLPFPAGTGRYIWGLLYMFPKYTLRWIFFRLAARRTRPGADLRAVRNPRKVEKLRGLAEQHGLDPERFVASCERLLRWWPLLP